MKIRIVIGLLLLGALLLLAGCNEQTGTSQGTTSPTATTAATAVSGTQEVHVVIKDGSISSTMKNFRAGIPYTFVVANQGKTSHNFIIWHRISGAASTQQPHDGILYIVPATQLTAGKTLTFSYQFPLSSIQSSLQFTTHLSGTEPEGPHIPVNVTKG